MKKFTADFETATWLENESYVWAWATCDIDNEQIEIGNTIESFIDFCYKNKNSQIFFHNLRFDGSFLISWALSNGFSLARKAEEIKDNTFTTLISDLGLFYQICFYFKKGNKTVHKVTFIDSLKIIPFSVKKIAKSFNLPISKLEINYNVPRRIGHILTTEERDYIKNDVLIVAKALKILFDEKLTKMTQGSNAITDFKNIITSSKFSHFFPSLDYEVDKDIRQGYRGGFTYVNPIYQRQGGTKGCSLGYQQSIPFLKIGDEI